MQHVRVRLASVEDFEALDRIRAAAFATVFASFRVLVGASIASVAFRDAEREQQDLLRDHVEPNDERIMLVAERDGVVCGFCAVMCKAETKVGEIGLNAVAPRRSGPWRGPTPLHRRSPPHARRRHARRYGSARAVTTAIHPRGQPIARSASRPRCRAFISTASFNIGATAIIPRHTATTTTSATGRPYRRIDAYVA
jgi:hypothetical protein